MKLPEMIRAVGGLLVLSLSSFLVLSVLSGCMTSAKEKSLQKDIFNLQTRLLQVEEKLSNKEKNEDAADTMERKEIATVAMDMQRIEQELNKIHGDIDALKVGVETGQMPGSSDEPKPGSVAAQIIDILSRLDELETAQADLIAAIKKAGVSSKASNKSSKKKKKSTSKSKSVREVRADFNKKRYRYVVEAVPVTLKKVRTKKTKSELEFLEAESLYKLGRLREAALKFNEYAESYPKSKQVPHAMMRMGDCFRHLNDRSTAKIYYQEVVKKYPDSDQAKASREHLEKI